MSLESTSSWAGWHTWSEELEGTPKILGIEITQHGVVSLVLHLSVRAEDDQQEPSSQIFSPSGVR